MQRLLKFTAALALGLIFLGASATESVAQDGIRNLTDCAITFEYKYSPTGTCNPTGSGSITVAPNTTVQNVTPPGTSFFQVQGIDENQDCEEFTLQAAVPCLFQPIGGTSATITNCPECGGTYTVSIVNQGILAQ